MECTKKVYKSQEQTQKAINLLIEYGKIENQNYDIYFCEDCRGWHFGTSFNPDVGWKPKK